MKLWKRLLFASLTVLVFFAALELLLALLGVDALFSERDPFQGFSEEARVYELDRQRDVYRALRRAVTHSFNYQEFAATKTEEGLRIFVLGGSSAYGFPWGASAAFPEALGRALGRARPDRTVESINAAAMSYGSHRLRILVPELLTYDPDLLVLYTGHNEFVERSFYRDLLERPQQLDRFRALLYRWRTYAWITRLSEGLRGDRTGEATPRTTGQSLGLDVDREYAVDVDDLQRDEARDRFEENLRAIVERARAADVAVLLCTVPSNLRGWKPNQSAFTPGRSETERRHALTLLDQGRAQLQGGSVPAALSTLEQAAEIAPEHAGVFFALGRAYLAVDRPDEARDAFESARDLDARPARAVGLLNETVRRVALDSEALLVDVERVFAAHAVDGVPGFDLFEDYVHPKPRGHRLIAREIWKALVESGFGGPALPADEDLFWQSLGLTGEPDPATDAPLAAASANTPPLLYNLAVVLENQGLESQAMQRYRQCLKLDPSYFAARANLGRLLFRAGRFEEAAEQYRGVLDMQEGHTASWIGLGESLMSMRRPDAAIDALSRATELDPRSAHAWHSLALALSRTNRHAETEQAFRRALSLDAHNPDVRTNLGFALLVQGKLDQAREAFEATLERDASHLRAQNGMAATLAETGALDEAERLFRAVLDTDPGDAFARAGLQRIAAQRNAP